MTSHCLATKNLGLNKTFQRGVMAALSISSLVSFFSDEQKSLTRGENHYKSNHIERFTYSDGIIRGEVHASIKKKVYKVTVSLRSNIPFPGAQLLNARCIQILKY